MLIVALVTFVMLVVLATAAQRLLGVRFGVIRTFLAALLAFVLAGPLLSPILASFDTRAENDPGIGPMWVLFLVAMCVVLIPMVFLVLAEAHRPMA